MRKNKTAIILGNTICTATILIIQNMMNDLIPGALWPWYIPVGALCLITTLSFSLQKLMDIDRQDQRLVTAIILLNTTISLVLYCLPPTFFRLITVAIVITTLMCALYANTTPKTARHNDQAHMGDLYLDKTEMVDYTKNPTTKHTNLTPERMRTNERPTDKTCTIC